MGESERQRAARNRHLDDTLWDRVTATGEPITGAEHVGESERLLRFVDFCLGAGDYDYQAATHDVAVAQVHATLALAAAVRDTDRETWESFDQDVDQAIIRNRRRAGLPQEPR